MKITETQTQTQTQIYRPSLLFLVIRNAYYVFLACIPLNVYSQKKIEIIKAGSLKFADNIADGAKRLIGDVQFKHEDTFMYCDSAYFYSDNSLDAFGHIRIEQNDGVKLYGDFLKYSGIDKLAVIKKNVIFKKADMELTTDVLNYDISTGIGYYNTSGRIVNKENILISDRGSFYSKTNEFYFKKNVELTNPQFVINCDTMKYNTVTKITYFMGPTKIKSKENLIYCEEGWYDTDNDLSRFYKNSYIISKELKMIGDSLYYDRKQGVGKAFNNISIIDTVQKLTINGDYAIHNEWNGVSIITGKALMMQRYESDTLYLHADTLKVVSFNPSQSQAVKQIKKESPPKKELGLKNKKHKNKELELPVIKESQNTTETTKNYNQLFAYRKVKFFKNDLQGKCDSLSYNSIDSAMKMYGRPILWSEENQLTADSIKIHTGEKAIQAIELKSSGFIVSMEDSLHYNQIRGKYMKGYFKKNELYLIKVEGNGQTIYYATEKNKLKALNRADCSNLNIYLEEKKMHHITFITKPEATLYPIEQIDPKEFKLKDFNWRGSERPLKMRDIFNW